MIVRLKNQNSDWNLEHVIEKENYLERFKSLLIKIDEGTFGYCEETGKKSDLKRLEARPVATYTLEAQERREITEKQFKDTR